MARPTRPSWRRATASTPVASLTSYLRVRALPLETSLRAFVEKYDRVYVTELNQDGQMHQLVQLHVPELAAKVRSVRICDGLPMSARFVTEAILEQEA